MPQPERLRSCIVDRCVLEIFTLKLEALHAETGIDKQVYEYHAQRAADHLRDLVNAYGFVQRGSRVLVGDDFYVAVRCAAPNQMDIGHLLGKETTL